MSSKTRYKRETPGICEALMNSDPLRTIGTITHTRHSRGGSISLICCFIFVSFFFYICFIFIFVVFCFFFNYHSFSNDPQETFLISGLVTVTALILKQCNSLLPCLESILYYLSLLGVRG